MGSFLSTLKCNIVNMNNVVETNNIKPNNVTSPSDEEFVNYLNSLWSSEIDNVRIFNDLPSHNEINEDDLKKFKEMVESKFDSIKVVGNFNYSNKMEKEMRLTKNELDMSNIRNTYMASLDLTNHQQINNNLMNSINKVRIYSKIKDTNKSSLNVTNYRFLQDHSKEMKLLDRLWCLKIIELVKSLDKNIFKSNLAKDMDSSVVETADMNTRSRENIALIDIEKAFDSCDFEVVEKLLQRNLSKKIGDKLGSELTQEYLYLIKQRIVCFKDKQIIFKKGIPTGLPSSNIIFSLIMEEIITEWQNENKELFTINKDFTLNIFVDDIYLKLTNLSIKDIIVKTLIDKISFYKFRVNFEKCKADEKLQLEFFTNLHESDYYLGIPFTRDLRYYSDIILKKYNNQNNNMDTYSILYNKLVEKHDDYKAIYGYFNYKLKPLMNNKETLIMFFEKYLI